MRRSRRLRPLAAALLLLLARRAAADESLLPAPIQAGRLDALLERSGAESLPIDERRAIAQVYAGYVARYQEIRDARVERWSKELEDLVTLRSPPDEKAVRHLLAEHRALCERAADLDRGLMDDVAAIVGDGVDIPRVRALREIDRWAQTMPLHAAVGTRGDLWSMCRHLDLEPDAQATVDAALRDRDIALQPLVQRVWTSWRELLLAASRSFEAETGGVLPVIGAALSEEEARRLRDRIVDGCRADAEACREARQRVRELDRRTIDRILSAIPVSEGQELRLRLLAGRGAALSSLVVNVEACHRAALRRFTAPHPASAALEGAYNTWREAFARLQAADQEARDDAQDRGILEPSLLGDALLDGNERVYNATTATMAETSRSLAELGSILEPFEAELPGSGVGLRRERWKDERGTERERPVATSVAWQSSIGGAYRRSDAEAAMLERSASLLGRTRAGIAAPMDAGLLDAARLAARTGGDGDAPPRTAWDEAVARHADAVAGSVEAPLRAAVAEAATQRQESAAAGGASDDAPFRRVIAARDELFFVAERLDQALFDELAALLPRGADRLPIEDARLERTLDRELQPIQLTFLPTANPWAALRQADLAEPERAAAADRLRAAMRSFLPDVRRARAANFAKDAADDLSILRSGFGLVLPGDDAVHRAVWDAESTLERSFVGLLETLLDTLGGRGAPAADRFAEAYARLTMLPEPAWSPATRAVIDGLPTVGVEGDRLVECRGRIDALHAERERLVLERAEVRAAVRPVRQRLDEARRLVGLIDALDDQLRTELLGLLTPEERRILVGTDLLDHLLSGAPSSDAAPAGT